MEHIIKIAKGIIRQGKIESTGNGFYTVDGEQVRIEKKPGRTVWSCSCKSCSRFCNNNNICSRKLAVILLEAQDPRLKYIIRTNMVTAKQSKEYGMSLDPDEMIALLNDLQSFV